MAYHVQSEPALAKISVPVHEKPVPASASGAASASCAGTGRGASALLTGLDVRSRLEQHIRKGFKLRVVVLG
jgi:hypothetical protein